MFLPLENTIHIFAPPVIFFFLLYMHIQTTKTQTSSRTLAARWLDFLGFLPFRLHLQGIPWINNFKSYEFVFLVLSFSYWPAANDLCRLQWIHESIARHFSAAFGSFAHSSNDDILTNEEDDGKYATWVSDM